MREKPDTLQELLRAALRSQVELGLKEIIINLDHVQDAAPGASLSATASTTSGSTPSSGESGWIGQVETVRSIETAASLFGDSDEILPPPQHQSLEEHRKAVNGCRQCPLADSRTNFVYGVGDPKAELMFVGEAPGRDEDLKGEPFVGAAGQLLDKILGAMKMARSEVYIANVLKCRPPNNRDPLPEEIAECLPLLKEQIRIIRPKVICCLGRISAQVLLDTKSPLGKLRRQWHSYETIPLLVTYHPAALLRFPVYKKDTWDDMQMVMAKLEELRK